MANTNFLKMLNAMKSYLNKRGYETPSFTPPAYKPNELDNRGHKPMEKPVQFLPNNFFQDFGVHTPSSTPADDPKQRFKGPKENAPR